LSEKSIRERELEILTGDSRFKGVFGREQKLLDKTGGQAINRNGG
jgi:hypothetical protein